MRAILLIMIGLSVLNAEITRESNGIVTDTSTKLQWQDDAVGSAMSWEAAIAQCEGLELDGTGWRLPNINELKSIVDKSKYTPAIVDGFANTRSSYYWSSTSYEDTKHSAWIVRFDGGYSSYGLKDYNFYVRCVRDGQ